MNKPAGDMAFGGFAQPRLFMILFIAFLAVVPIIFVQFPPSTDLPQHIAQVRLFKEALAHPDGPYSIQWLGPGNLIYFFLLPLSAILPAGRVAQAILIVLVLLWLAAIYGLAVERRRAFAGAILGALLIYNQALYWGFLNFLIGFPVFVLWFILTTKNDSYQRTIYYLALAGTAGLLYESHSLWFAAGGAWLALVSLMKRIPARSAGLRLAAMVPWGIAALIWYPRLSSMRGMAGYDLSPHWSIPFDRILHFVEAASGGAVNAAGIISIVAVLSWLALSVWQNRNNLKTTMDRDLLAASFFFLMIVLVAPDKYMDTIFFSARWVPPALLFLLLALPAPSFRSIKPRLVAATVALLFFSATAYSWHMYNCNELSGFRGALRQITPSSRILGLDLIKDSDYVQGRPFLQLFAYAQVLNEAELNFSFAEHYSSLVAYRGVREVPWTRMLEWYAEDLERTDLRYFDYVVINARPLEHAKFASFPELCPLTRVGRWRAYKVVGTDRGLEAGKEFK